MSNGSANQKLYERLRDSAKFRRFCRLLYEMSGLNLVIMNTKAELRNGLDTYIKERDAPFCEFMRRSPKFLKACNKCDARHYAEAVKKKRALCYTCHAGLVDMIVPIRINAVHAGALIGGQLFVSPPTEESFAEFYKKVSSYGFDREKLKRLFFETKRMEARRLRCAVELAELFAEHVEELGSRIFMERKVEGLAERALEILRHEYRTQLTLDELAERLGVTPQYASSLLSKETGDTFSGHISALRVERVKLLLSSTSYSLGYIATESGFGSIRSFNRCFRELTGMSPGEWRKSFSGKA